MDNSPMNARRDGGGFKSPYPSPKSATTYGSPDFKPFSYSSPEKVPFSNNRRARNARYFNPSSYGTPLNHHKHQRRRGDFHNHRGRGRRSNEAPDVSCYVHWSMTEDPWSRMEKSLLEKESLNPQKSESNPKTSDSKAELDQTKLDKIFPDKPD